MLTDLLKPELVACHVEASDWEEAIRACGKLLVDAGKCDQSYADAMISSVHKFGPYMVLEEGIAMPHAQADGNVSEAGICIVTLDPAVAFGHEDFDPVHVLVGICAPDPKAHLGCLAELSQMFEDEDCVAKLSACDTPEQVLETMRSFF